MPRAIVDPREVRRFAAFLTETVSQLRSSKSSISRDFSDLHSVWKDKKYNHFEKVFQETLTHLEIFLKSSEMYADYLNKKARLAERYLE